MPQNGPVLPSFPKTDRNALPFSLFFWTRMLYSCMVDADFLDTEAFLQPEKAALRGVYPPLEKLHAAFNVHLEKLSAGAKPGTVNTQRAKVLAACRRAALLEQGLFSLTVPTGGGKTLSSLAFALGHAARNGLRRIIYVIPYTSIIEQTAEVFRTAFGPESAGAVVEHHSNAVDRDTKTAEGADWNEDARSLARDFRFIDDYELPLLIPYNDEVKADLDRLRAGETDRNLYRRLQQWTVGVPEKAMAALLGKSAGKIGFAGQYYELINEDLYNGLKGSSRNGPGVFSDSAHGS